MAFVFVSRFFTLVLLLLLSVFSLHCLAKCHVDDETGLLAFKSGITQDPSGSLSSWKSGTECCTTWSGVSCANGFRVTSIYISGVLWDPKYFLSGTISPSLSKVRYLTDISLLNLRNITGTFPIFLYNLPNLSIVNIDNNKLSGPLPVDVGQLYRLKQFSISGNRFTGSIPKSISKLTQLFWLQLDDNLFTGQIPKGIRQMKNLGYLNLEKNQFSSKIPDIFTTLSELRYLYLGYNKLTGELPPSLSALASQLAVFQISHTYLTGKIPDFLGNFQGLHTLDLSSNKLTGSVPTSFRNLTRISNLNLSRNRLVDPFPELNGTELDLDLSYNKFNLGKIPKWVATNPVVYSLKLSGCGLKFRLEDFKPKKPIYYSFIDLSDNQISGSPVGLLNPKHISLKGFLASGNQLRFNISNLIIPYNLENLDLARNQVFGKVPQGISGLKEVDLSHNHLCGQLPMTKFPAEAFLGNDCLCGSPLPPCKN